MKKCLTSKQFFLISWKFQTTFFSHSLKMSVSHFIFHLSTTHKSLQVQHSINVFSKFFGFHPSVPLSHFQIYNYNCRNCHQLHVKICPARRRSQPIHGDIRCIWVAYKTDVCCSLAVEGVHSKRKEQQSKMHDASLLNAPWLPPRILHHPTLV